MKYFNWFVVTCESFRSLSVPSQRSSPRCKLTLHGRWKTLNEIVWCSYQQAEVLLTFFLHHVTIRFILSLFLSSTKEWRLMCVQLEDSALTHDTRPQIAQSLSPVPHSKKKKESIGKRIWPSFDIRFSYLSFPRGKRFRRSKCAVRRPLR